MHIAMSEGWTSKFGTIGEKLFLATTLTIVGFVIVFIALTIVIFCIFIMSASIRSLSAKAVKTETPEVPLIIEADDNEIIAVITAAICAARASDIRPSERSAPYPGFRVRSIRRV